MKEVTGPSGWHGRRLVEKRGTRAAIGRCRNGDASRRIHARYVWLNSRSRSWTLRYQTDNLWARYPHPSLSPYPSLTLCL